MANKSYHLNLEHTSQRKIFLYLSFFFLEGGGGRGGEGASRGELICVAIFMLKERKIKGRNKLGIKVSTTKIKQPFYFG